MLGLKTLKINNLEDHLGSLGLIIEEQNPLDWQLGGFSPLLGSITKPSGDWIDNLPVVEKQNSGGYDRMACFPYDAPVLMEDLSYKRISEVRVGDFVITHKGRPKKVIGRMKREINEDVFSIGVSGIYENLVCTSEHPILTKRGWVPAKNITEGDFVLCPNNRHYKKDCSVYSVETDRDFLWIVGLFAAEGSLGKKREGNDKRKSLKVNGTGSGEGSITFSLGSHETHLYERIMSIFKRLFDTNTNIHFKKNSRAITVTSSNLWLRNLLEELVGTGCDSKKINKRLMLLDPSLQLEILKGWLVGDGSIKKRGTIVGVSVSRQLADDMMNICARNNIKACITKRGKVEGKRDAYGVSIYGNDVNRVFPGLFDRQQSGGFFRVEHYKKNYIARRVKFVKKSKKVKSRNSEHKNIINRVYNIEVEDDHSYIVDSIAVHNCVSYSLTNCLEILHHHQTGEEVNFSDRFLAKMSGTSKSGNTMTRVFDTARNIGLVDEQDWPDRADTWEEYYSQVPAPLIDKAGKWLEDWALYREYVKQDSITEALKSAPLWVIVKFASGNGILNPSGEYDHAVCLYNASEGEYYEIFDHYAQSRKRYAWDYRFGAIIKPTLISKKQEYMIKLPNNSLVSKATGRGINAAIYIDGKLLMDEDLGKVIKVWCDRSDDFRNKKTITEEAWNSLPHYSIDGKRKLN